MLLFCIWLHKLSNQQTAGYLHVQNSPHTLSEWHCVYYIQCTSDMHETCMPMLRICNKGPSYVSPKNLYFSPNSHHLVPI